MIYYAIHRVLIISCSLLPIFSSLHLPFFRLFSEAGFNLLVLVVVVVVFCFEYTADTILNNMVCMNANMRKDEVVKKAWTE